MRVGIQMPDTIHSRTKMARLGMRENLGKFYENGVKRARGEGRDYATASADLAMPAQQSYTQFSI